MPDQESTYFDLSLESLRAIGSWAADCAERALPVYESQAGSDSRPRAAIEGIREFAAGGRRVARLRTLALGAHAAAREVGDPAAAAAARAAGAAAASAYTHPLADVHQTKHVVGAAAYAALALELDAGDEALAEAEIRRAIEHAPSEARDVLLNMPAREPGKSRLDVMLYQLDAGIRTGAEGRARDVRIRPYDDADLPLLRALLGDAALTRFIGGPETEEALVARHARYLAADQVTNGLFTVLVEADPVGWVGFWESEWEGSTQWECGWHVLAAHQGKGAASAAARLLLDEARSRDRHRFVDAFPSAENVASNGLCRQLGFLDLGEVAVEYPKGTMMQARHWRYDLTGGVA